MSQPTAEIISAVAGYASASTAFIAAALWLWSARIVIPDPGQFPIVVVRPDLGPMGQPLGGTYVGNGYSEALQQWASNVSTAFGQQSRRSAWAAVSAGISAIAAVVAASIAIADLHLWF
jgi:hypothetical protein